MTRNPQKTRESSLRRQRRVGCLQDGLCAILAQAFSHRVRLRFRQNGIGLSEPSDQSDWACGQQQTPTSREIRSRRWKLAYRQNQHPLPQANPTVRTVNAGQRCAGQTLYPVMGLRKTRAFAASPRCWVLVSIFVLPFSAAGYHASRVVPRRLRHRP